MGIIFTKFAPFSSYIFYIVFLYIFYIIFNDINVVNKFINKISNNIFLSILILLFVDIVGDYAIIFFNLSETSHTIASQILSAFVTNIIVFLVKHHIKE